MNSQDLQAHETLFALYSHISTTSPPQSPAGSEHKSQFGYDVYEAYESNTQRSPQRQQHSSSRLPTRPTSSSGSVHSLRRTPKFDQPPRRRAASVGAQPNQRGLRESIAQLETAKQHPILPFSDDGDSTSTATPANPKPERSWWPERTLHISKRTASAILYVLEEAIRTPFPFTPDPAEENASMSALGGARPQNGGSKPAESNPPERAITTPTPREVLRQRRIREEAKKRQEEEERKKREEQKRLSAETKAAGVAANVGSGFDVGRPAPASQTQDPPSASGRQNQPVSRRPDTNVPVPGLGVQATSRPAPKAQQTQPSGPTSRTQTQSRPTGGPAGTTVRAQPGPSVASSSQRQQVPQPTPVRNGNVSSFPHAFERWEQLSSHWEGLTSYWINRLEGNADELSGQPINQQLARQLTDLSAAGANLFHAVVELQRLRASSERKFQRWFFETRNEQEKSQERIAQLERELKAEKEARAADAANGARRIIDNAALEEAQKIKKQAEAQLKEKERELQISRDEARRGWEEIGRMEQAERDRTFSLKRGQPTLVGGVQVVPMPQATGPVSPQPSSTREQGALSSHPVEREQEREGPREGYAPSTARSDTDTDPFLEGGRQEVPPVPELPATQVRSRTPSALAPGHTSAANTQTSIYEESALRTAPTSYPSGSYSQTQQPPSFYHHQGSGTALHEGNIPPRPPAPDDLASDTISEEEYEIDEWGRVRLDGHGNPIPYRRGPASEDSDDSNVAEELRREALYRAQFGTAGQIHTTNGSVPYSSAPDYSGQGYADFWEGVPRHHHPTRLSDVLEEDERSRTSPSRASERSRGVGF